MLVKLLSNTWVIMIICAVIVFGEMFFVKKWFTAFTKRISNVKVRKGVNCLLGVITAIGISFLQMWAICDVLGVKLVWYIAIASAMIATLIYLFIEKIWGDAVATEVGEAFCEVLNRSGDFNGDLSAKGMVALAKKLLGITTELDKKINEKEEVAIDKVVDKINEYMIDGVITDEERKAIDELMKGKEDSFNGNSVYEKYKALLNK